MEVALDTNLLIEIEKNNKEVLDKIRHLDIMNLEIFITSPTYSEYYIGLLKLSAEKFNEGIERLDKYKVLNTSKNSSKLLAEIKHHLSKKGIMIPVFDLIIASIALDCKIPLITLDKHFKRVPDLNVILI